MSTDWATFAAIAAPTLVGIAGISATFLSGRRAVAATAAEAERERAATARRAWVGQAADAYALGRLAWSHLPEDLTLGMSVARHQVPMERLASVEAECQQASKALRVLEAITSGRELATVIAEIHQRLTVLLNANMAAHNMVGIANAGTVPDELYEQSFDDVLAHAEAAKNGSPSGEGLERASFFELFERLREETARLGST